ncbi:MAG TPA: amino acid permease, partial [Thermoplasmataceae archaeon]|nr:amino acid permease [Thermoplasmataceae archaeon]
AQIIAIGGEMVAAGIYMQLWFPGVTPVVWIGIFALLLLSVNAIAVKAFGTFEYWFSMIKVVTIIVFIILGGFVLLSATRFGITPAYTAFGGFFPHGFKGVWLATVVALFSYIGVEVVAVTAGESSDPGKSVPRAMRGMVVRLVLFYVISLFIMVGMVPWTQAGVSESPFVTAFGLIGIPFAAALMNFVVLTAALSSSNTDIYLTIRMLFSLSRAKRAPDAFGKLNRFKVPFNALIIAAIGIAFSIYLDYSFGATSAYLDLFGIAVFGAIFTWIIILISHLSFRRRRASQGAKLQYHIKGAPVFSVIGIGLLVSVLISTWFTPGIQITIPSGVVTVIFFSIAYLYYLRTGKKNEQ